MVRARDIHLALKYMDFGDWGLLADLLWPSGGRLFLLADWFLNFSRRFHVDAELGSQIGHGAVRRVDLEPAGRRWHLRRQFSLGKPARCCIHDCQLGRAFQDHPGLAVENDFRRAALKG